MWQNFLRNTNLQQTADSQLFVAKIRRNNAQKTYNHEVLNSAWLRINGSQATKSHADIFSYRSRRLLHALRNVGSSDDAYRHRELRCVQHSLHHLPEPFGVALWAPVPFGINGRRLSIARASSFSAFGLHHWLVVSTSWFLIKNRDCHVSRK